jgi:hypothetical protein
VVRKTCQEFVDQQARSVGSGEYVDRKQGYGAAERNFLGQKSGDRILDEQGQDPALGSADLNAALDRCRIDEILGNCGRDHGSLEETHVARFRIGDYRAGEFERQCRQDVDSIRRSPLLHHLI